MKLRKRKQQVLSQMMAHPHLTLKLDAETVRLLKQLFPRDYKAGLAKIMLEIARG